MSNDNDESKKDVSEESDNRQDGDRACCFVVDPCGCYVDPCGCMTRYSCCC